MSGRNFFVFVGLATFDFAALLSSFAFCFFVRYLVETDGEVLEAFWLTFQKIWFFVGFSLFILFLFYVRGLYRKRIGFWDETKEIVRTGVVFIVVFFFATAIFKLDHTVSRIALLFGTALMIFLIPLLKLHLKHRLYKSGIWGERVAIVGRNRRAVELARKFSTDSYLGYRVVGFVKASDVIHAVASKKVETVIICDEVSSKELMNIQKLVKNVILVPSIDGIAILNTEFNYSFEERSFFLTIKNNLKSQSSIFIKRALDLLLVALLLPFVLTCIAVIAILIRLDSKGSAIFVQRRLGSKGEFLVYKFRSMYENSDEILERYLLANESAATEWRVYKKLKGEDPRVTRVGKWIRSLSLDELPQIFNVLKGEMSIVGPRPYLPSESDDMGDKKEYILEAKPGITGLWQVSGRNELTFEERLSMDVWYVLNWSVWLDVVILLKTVKVVLKKSGAY